MRTTLAIAAALALVTLTTAPVSAQSGVSSIPRFADDGKVQHPLIDADGQGRATATWIRIGAEREVWSSNFDGRVWSCPTVLPGSKGALGYTGATWDLAEASSGAAVLGGALNSEGDFEGAAVWTRVSARQPWVQVRWSDPNAFAILQRTGPPSVALTGSEALVAWVAQDNVTSTLYAAKIPVGSTAPVTPTEIYTKSGLGWLDTDPDVGIDAQGNALIQFEDWVNYDHPLFMTMWPAGGNPTTSVLKPDVLTKDHLTSMHVNAAGQMVTTWGYAPDGAPNYQQIVGLGSTTSGLSTEGIWQTFGADGVYSYPNAVGSDIDAGGTVSVMVLYEDTLIGGLGTVASGLGSLAPRATMSAPNVGENWDVTVAAGRAIVSLQLGESRSILAELRGSGFDTAAAAPNTMAPNSALVRVAGALVPALVGTDAGGGALRTTLPTKVGRCRGR